MCSTARSTTVVKFLDFLELCRVGNLPTVWVSTLAAGLLSGGAFSLPTIFLLLIALSMMYCGGMAMNDCIDSVVDAAHRTSRPIPSGRVTVSEGKFTYFLLFASAMAVFWAAGGFPALVAGLFLLILILAYNLSHNRTVLAVVPMAGSRFMIYIITGLAFSDAVTVPLVSLAIVQFAYILLLTLVARLEKRHTPGETFTSVVPLMLAGIPLIDGTVLALAIHGGWFAAGVAGGVATLASQRAFRGD